MSIDIGIFSLQQFHNLQHNLGINNITGQHRPNNIRGMKLISLGEPISNVTLGNGVETYPGGWPRFSINRHNEEMKLRFDPEHVDWWAGPDGPSEPNVDGLEGEFNLIYDDDRTPIGVKLDDDNYDNWLYFIELEDNISPHDPDEFRNTLFHMEANRFMSSNPEETGPSVAPAAPAALTGEFLGVWGGKKRRKKRTKKKSRKTRKKRKKKTKKRRKKRKRKKRKTRR